MGNTTSTSGSETRNEQSKDQDGSAIAEPEHNDPITPEQHQFDFDCGTWVTHSTRLVHPLTGSQWNLDFATPQVGTLGTPGVGTFKDGRAEFYGFDTVGGRNILVRFPIWKITDDTAQSEQAFSADGGKTWEVNWINHYIRLAKE